MSFPKGVGDLADELRVSLEFYGAQEGAPPIDKIVVNVLFLGGADRF